MDVHYVRVSARQYWWLVRLLASDATDEALGSVLLRRLRSAPDLAEPSEGWVPVAVDALPELADLLDGGMRARVAAVRLVRLVDPEWTGD